MAACPFVDYSKEQNQLKRPVTKQSMDSPATPIQCCFAKRKKYLNTSQTIHFNIILQHRVAFLWTFKIDSKERSWWDRYWRLRLWDFVILGMLTFWCKQSSPFPKKKLVGGCNPSEKYSSNWIIFPSNGEHSKKYLSCHHLTKRSLVGLCFFLEFCAVLPGKPNWRTCCCRKCHSRGEGPFWGFGTHQSCHVRPWLVLMWPAKQRWRWRIGTLVPCNWVP